MPKDKKSYTYAPRPLTARPASETAHDMTKRTPASGDCGGKFGGLGKKVSGGGMQGGGKTRSGKM